MGSGNRFGLALSIALILLFAGTMGSPQTAGRVAVRSVSTGANEALKTRVTTRQARVLEGRVSRLAPARTMVATPLPPPAVTETAPGDSATGPTAVRPRPPVRLIPTAPARTPPTNAIQYVRTDRALDQEISSALVSQPSIRDAIGGTGLIAPLPGILRQTDATGEVVQLKAFALRGRPLVYDAAQRLYRGTIILGVADIVPGRPQRALSVPIVFQVLNADSADPAETSFDRTSPPYKEVRLSLSAVRPVQILSALIPDGGVDIALQLNPTLSVEAGHGAIEGLGLETTQVNISLLGIDRPLGRVVTLHTDAGYLDPTRVRLDEQGNASVTIRSGNVGQARITATTAGVERAHATVDFRFPYATLIASIIGGLAGGFVRPRRRRSARALTAAAVWGLIVFVSYAVGINLLPWMPSVTVGAALVFAVSALGAFFGPALLRRS